MRTLIAAAILVVACSSSKGGDSASVLERNKHPSRDGYFVEPLLTNAAVARMAMDTGFTAAFPGTMFASPLFLENGPHGKGVFFAVTTSNDVFALDETTGAVVWQHNIGPSPMNSGAGCGGIHPIGIVSTPVIDAQARTIFVAGAVGTATIDRHEVHALSVDDGSERTGWPVNVSTLSSGALQFSPQPHNQRSALSLVKGILYVAYGGHVGDCGPYHGWVVGIDAHNPTKAGAWATGGQGEGIWASGGMASDGNGVFAETGNATSGTTTHLDSEEVVRITGLGVLDRSTSKNFYFPTIWHDLDAGDLDFASNSPVYFEVPGATPATFVAATSKAGHVYLLDSKNLGGMNGHVVDFAAGSAAFTAPTVYTSMQGVHIAMNLGGVQCPAGQPAAGVASILIPPGAPPVPRIVWCAADPGNASPITTSADGKTQAIVWFMNGDRLNGVDGDTGQVIYGGGSDSCPNVLHWTSPIAVKGRIVVGATGRLCSWSPHPSDAGPG